MRQTFALLALLMINSLSLAQSQSVVKTEDYARAGSFLSASTTALVSGLVVNPMWLDNGQLVYRNSVPEGVEYVIADPAKGSRTRAFDHERLAKALSAAADTTLTAFLLRFRRFKFSADGGTVTFAIGRRQYLCDLETYECKSTRNPNRNAALSPDSKLAAFIRDHNLWLRDVKTGEETQLTTDGVKDFGYATTNAGWIKRDSPVLLWSPNSDKIATFQHDGRGVGEMYLVRTKVGHPELEAWKYPLPEDSVIFRQHRVVIHLDGPRVVRLQMPADPHRSTISDHVADRKGNWLDVEWSTDGSQLAFVSSSRDHKQAKLRLADPETGKVRDVFEENVDTFFESGYRKVNWHVLQESKEAIWFSQRDDWGHLYLYDLRTGELKNRITSGDWTVLQVLHLDPQNRTILFTAAGRESGDPYFHYLYSVKMDGSALKLLTPETANHKITLDPSGSYFVDNFSTPVMAPMSVVRNREGRTLQTLEKADVSRLQAAGWQPPVPIKVKARDGKTTLYGLMYKPTNFDATRSYPILNYIYPGPQSGSVGSRAFAPSRSDKQSLAELGFIVVEIDAMGTPMRTKSFHAAYYGNMGDNGLPDQIAALKELAGRHSWMDINRVGIWGHSGGGFASTAGILRYPDFYKVAVSGAGNHDNRNYEDDWGEKWQGLLVNHADGSSNYDNQANHLLAKNLKGKLLLAHGTMDNNVPPSNTMLVVNALIAANKDFDLLLLPNRRHGFGREPYMMRRRWDYFVRHLLGVEPPKEYRFRTDTKQR